MVLNGNMTPEEEKSNKIWIEQLEERIKKLEDKKQVTFEGKKYEDIKFYPVLKVEKLIIKYVKQSTEPIPLSNEILLWQDTDDNKTYIVANFNGTTNSIELI
jgi:hypothetical protein